MLILASASPRRHEILSAAGIAHVVRPARIPEERRDGESPVAFVRRLAEEKALAVPHSREDIVLGADTVVCIDEQVLGKPSDSEDAARMLRLLSGRVHLVHTGFCLLAPASRVIDVATTRVAFAGLTPAEIDQYVRSGEPHDKAGAYAIQGCASKFVRWIDGCYFNVVGLP